jgi:hypothetical protein
MKLHNIVALLMGAVLGLSLTNLGVGFERYFSTPARAQIAVPGVPMLPLGTCQLTSLAASTGLASCSGGIPTGANAVVLRAEAQALRYRSDAGTAASTAGVPILVADPPLFWQGALANLSFIESTSGGKLNALFYRAPQ